MANKTKAPEGYEHELYNINVIRTNLMEIQDAIRFMAMGHQFKDFLEEKISKSLTALYDIQNPQ